MTNVIIHGVGICRDLDSNLHLSVNVYKAGMLVIAPEMLRERESQSESDGETKIWRNKPCVAFTSRTRTEGSVGPEGTTDALQNGEVLKNESWNEWVSRPVPKALPGLREGEDEPENTKLERSYQEPQAR
ncbi:hypothetical protein C8F01DRAFT_1084506 [Mycena amicta]|nr:hypothetical protein C8F01DRAFT_1084506 [Mycena amicta]